MTMLTKQPTTANDSANRINEVCRNLGGPYQDYRCAFVSWDDVSRSSFGGNLSTVGPNITDTYLKTKDGNSLFTVRPSNWNERLGRVSASEIAVVARNSHGNADLRPVTLLEVLQKAGQYGQYAGLAPSANLSAAALDDQVSIRFQTTFLPAKAASVFHQKPNVQFATEAYNYQTRSESDPKNLLLLCTTQGVAVQQDGVGATKLLHHKVQFGQTTRHWLEAESSSHVVGMAQQETAQERTDAIARGKATAAVIGPRCLGTRFNCLMTVQIPLKQQRRSLFCVQQSLSFGAPVAFGGGGSTPCGFMSGAAPPGVCFPKVQKFGSALGASTPYGDGFMSGAAPPDMFVEETAADESAQMFGSAPGASTFCRPSDGTASAARVSIGDQYDTWTGLKAKAPVRHDTERITVTVVLYNIVQDGVPSVADVKAAIDDLEKLYAACSATKRAGSNTFNETHPTGPAVQSDVKGYATFPTPPKPTSSTYHPLGELPDTVLHKASQLTIDRVSVEILRQQGTNLLSNLAASPDQLWEAYGYFRVANDMHTQLQLTQHPTCLYDMACCCSRLAEAKDAGMSRSVDQLIDASLSWLVASVGAGWQNFEHMKTDRDLEMLRKMRPVPFGAAVELARQSKNGF